MSDAPVYKPLVAVGWMAVATCSFVAMAIGGREVAAELNTFELMMYRSFIGIAIVVTFGAATHTLGQIRVQRMHLHLIRNVGHFTGQNLWFFAVATIPLAQVVALEFTTPLWVALLAPLFLGEKTGWLRAVAIGLGFVGVLCVARPDTLTLEPGIIAAGLCAIGFATSFIATKKLTSTEGIVCIMFWLTVMQAIFALVIAGYDGHVTVPSLDVAPFVLLVSCTGLLAHFALTRALQVAPASIVAPLDFARLPLVAFVGFILYNEQIVFSLIVGAALILAANTLNLRAQAMGK